MTPNTQSILLATLTLTLPSGTLQAQVNVSHAPTNLIPAAETEIAISIQADPGQSFDLGAVIFEFDPNHVELIDFRWESGLDAGLWFSDTQLPAPGTVFSGSPGAGPIVSDAAPFLVATITLRAIGCDALYLDSIPLIIANSTDFSKRFIASGMPMTFQSSHASPTPVQAVEAGSRYIALNNTPQDLPIAIRVTSPDFPCLSRFVDTTGRLADAPVYQLDSDWDALLVSDIDIVPDAAYTFTSFCGLVETDSSSATTHRFGDLIPDGTVDLFDIFCVLDAFNLNFDACPLANADIAPDEPDADVGLFDINAVLDAFNNDPYPGPLPCP